MSAQDVNWETAIDWSQHTHSEHTCTCRCGAVFRSHTVFKLPGPLLERAGLVSRKPCPVCHSHLELVRASSDPETYIL